MPQALVTTQQAAAYLGLPARTIRSWVQTGRLTRHGTPRQLQIDLFELQPLTEQQAA